MIQAPLGGYRANEKDPLKKLTLKVPITTAADNIYKYFSLSFRENKI